jgi:hypothetical protein
LEAFLTVLRIPFSSACQVTSLPSVPLVIFKKKETHLTDLETVLLCFLISELSLLSKEGLNTSLADPPLLELEDILFSMTIEMEVKPGSVFCRSRSGLGDLTINFGVGEIRRNNSGIRPLGSLDDGTGGGGIDRPEVVEGIEFLDDPKPVEGMDGLDVDDPRGSR